MIIVNVNLVLMDAKSVQIQKTVQYVKKDINLRINNVLLVKQNYVINVHKVQNIVKNVQFLPIQQQLINVKNAQLIASNVIKI